MADRDFFRVFVGGLSWDTTDRGLENAFRRFGKVLDATVMLDGDTGRPRGFGFVTFADESGMEDAIADMHNRELDGRVISVKKAQPKTGSGGYDYGGGGYSNNDGGKRGDYGGRGGGGGSDDCFKCGQSGHWARDCPYARDSGGRYGSRDRDRYEGGGGRSDRYSGFGYSGTYSDRDDRYGRDRYGSSDRYGDGYYKNSRSGGYADRDRYGGYADRDRYGGYTDRDRYGTGGPTRREESYKERSGPYSRPAGGRTSYDDRY